MIKLLQLRKRHQIQQKTITVATEISSQDISPNNIICVCVQPTQANFENKFLQNHRPQTRSLKQDCSRSADELCLMFSSGSCPQEWAEAPRHCTRNQFVTVGLILQCAGSRPKQTQALPAEKPIFPSVRFQLHLRYYLLPPQLICGPKRM